MVNYENEQWKELPMNSAYEVSNMGRVRYWACQQFLLRNETPVFEPTIINPGVQTRGYHMVPIKINGRKICKTVHRLVALTWIPNPNNKPQVNHKNFIKTDNRAENLEWCTLQENVTHSVSNGRHRGPKNPVCKLTGDQVDFMRNEYASGRRTGTSLAEQFGISKVAAYKVINGHSWRKRPFTYKG